MPFSTRVCFCAARCHVIVWMVQGVWARLLQAEADPYVLIAAHEQSQVDNAKRLVDALVYGVCLHLCLSACVYTMAVAVARPREAHGVP